MYNNSYFGGNQYGTPNYNTFGQSYGTYQPQVTQRPMATQQYQDIPFSDVMYGTFDEAKAYIVAPTKSVMFIDRDKSEFYVKSADNMGKSFLEPFKYSKLDENPTEPKQPEIDLSQFVKSSDLIDFVTKQDLATINEKLDTLSKQVRINEILKGGDNNGK